MRLVLLMMMGLLAVGGLSATAAAYDPNTSRLPWAECEMSLPPDCTLHNMPQPRVTDPTDTLMH